MSTFDSDDKQPEEESSSKDEEIIELEVPETVSESEEEFIVISSEPESDDSPEPERNDFGVLTKTFELNEDDTDDDFDEPMLESSDNAATASIVDAEELADSFSDETDVEATDDDFIETPVELTEDEQEKVLELQLDKPLVLSDVLNEDDIPEESDDSVEDDIVVDSEEISEDGIDESEDTYEEKAEGEQATGSRIAWLIYPAAVLGIVLRILWYLKNSALNAQEAALSHALISRNLTELFQPLGEGQIAPIGFLIKVKMHSLLFGDNEYMLRLYSLSASILALIFFVWTIRKLVEPVVAVIAVALLSLSFPLIEQAATLSPWSGDFMAATLMLLLGTQSVKHAPSMKLFGVIAVIGLVLQWFSLTFIFILFGIGLTLFLEALWSRDGAKIKGMALLNCIWLVGFIVHYFIALKPYLNDSTLRETYSAYFFPIPSNGSWFRPVYWLGERATAIFVEPLGIVLPGLGLFACLLGSIVLIRTQRSLLMMLLLPLVGLLIASALRLYPMHEHLLHCLAPALAITCAVGLSGLIHLLWSARRRAAVFLIALIFVPNAVLTTHAILRAKDEGITAALQYWIDSDDAQAEIYIDGALRNQFHYYTRSAIDLNPDSIQVGVYAADEWAAYDNVLKRYQGQSSVWFLLQKEHAPGIYGYFLSRLNGMGRVESHEQWGSVHLYQYDLSVAPIQSDAESTADELSESIETKEVTVEPDDSE